MGWHVFDVKDTIKVIKPYATRFWQKRFYHDGHGNDQIFANVWEYPPVGAYGPTYIIEIDIPSEVSPTGMYLRIETFNYERLDTILWDEHIQKILISMFPWIRKELE